MHCRQLNVLQYFFFFPPPEVMFSCYLFFLLTRLLPKPGRSPQGNVKFPPFFIPVCFVFIPFSSVNSRGQDRTTLNECHRLLFSLLGSVVSRKDVLTWNVCSLMKSNSSGNREGQVDGACLKCWLKFSKCLFASIFSPIKQVKRLAKFVVNGSINFIKSWLFESISPA